MIATETNLFEVKREYLKANNHSADSCNANIASGLMLLVVLMKESSNTAGRCNRTYNSLNGEHAAKQCIFSTAKEPGEQRALVHAQILLFLPHTIGCDGGLHFSGLQLLGQKLTFQGHTIAKQL